MLAGDSDRLGTGTTIIPLRVLSAVCKVSSASLGIDHMTLALARPQPFLFRTHSLSISSAPGPSSPLVSLPFLRLRPSLPSDRHLSPNSQDSPLVASSHHASCADRPNTSADSQCSPPPPRAGCSPIRLAPFTALAGWARFGTPSPCWKCLWFIFVYFLASFRLRLFALLVTLRLALAVEYLTTIQ